MSTIKKRYQQYRAVISYLFFGVITTLINIGVFAVLNHYGHWNYQLANIIAWFLSVLFAYITNKIWVFQSKTTTTAGLFKEMGNFFLFRILSLLIDVVILFIGITLLKQNALLIKVIDNVIVVVVNYLVSKVFIFKGEKDH